MIVLGLTGSIGMGKSTTATLFRQAGVWVHDADASVHRLYAGAAVPLIEQAFPGTTINGVVDRARLSAAVLGDNAAMKRLEQIIHPLVRAQEQRFVAESKAAHRPLVVLDIPLLFETGGERRCDAVVVVTADPAVQRARVMQRPGMTREIFAAILARQLPDAEKRRRAHFLIDTGRGMEPAHRQVEGLLRSLAGRSGKNGHSVQEKSHA
jgi:dephospho-CoA kinase